MRFRKIRSAPATVIAVGALMALSAGVAIAARHPGHPVKAAAAAPPSLIALSQIHVLDGQLAPFALDARAAMLVDAKSGALIYAYNEHLRIPPASLAKIMTFYLALEALHRGAIALDTQVTISEQAWRLSMDQTVSRMFLDVGQRVPVRDLLYGLMVSSGNDAAVALAEQLAGSSDSFVKMMNDKCGELGLRETRFASPDGLPAPDQYTTASDMVKLARDVVRRFPEAFTYTSTKEYTFHKIEQRNFNTLLFYDPRVNGLKTGHVAEAGYHLVATASSNGMDLVSAVMGSPSMEKRRLETEKLIDWAFRTFVSVAPEWRNAVPATIRAYEGSADKVAIAPIGVPVLTVDRADQNKVGVSSVIRAKYLVAPVPKGESVGELTVTVNGKPRASVPIETSIAVGRGGFLHRLADRIRLIL